MVRYLVVKTSKKNGNKSVCNNGASYVNRLTAVRHLHMNEMGKKASLFTYEVMAIPAYMVKINSLVHMWIRDDEETRAEILKEI